MSAPEIGILTTDTALVIRSWDAWLAQVTGIAPDEACGRPLAELAPAAATLPLRPRLDDTLASGTVHVLSPALHHYLVPCPPRSPSRHFEQMRQRVHIGPLVDGERIVGLMITIADVTARVEAERDLAEGLASPDPEERREASATLAAATKVESLEPFADALGADDWKVRRATVQGLASSAGADVLHEVVDTLRRNHRNFNALSSALKLLSLSDVPITAPLAELLKDDDPDLRIQAALALGEQQDASAVGGLIASLEDPDDNVRFHAIEALGRLRAVEAVDPLVAIAERADFFLSFAAIDALSMIHDATVAPRLAPLLADANLREAVAGALGALADDQAVLPLVGALNAGPEGAAAIAGALVAIERRQEGQFGEGGRVVSRVRQALDAAGERHLVAALRTADVAGLPALVRVLGWLGRDRSAPELVTLLGRPEVRDEIIEALVRHGERVVEPVIAQLASDDDDVRAAAISTLGRLGSRRATGALVPLLDDERDVAIAAAGALAKIGDPDAFEALLAHVTHGDPAVRQSVVGALNSIGHPDMPARVTALLAHADPAARESAVRVAGYFGYAESADRMIACATDPVETVRVAALEHLAFLDDPRVLDVLRAALAQDSPRARAAAARALGRLHEEGVRETLDAALADPDPWVRYYAVRSVADRRDVLAVPALLAIADNDSAAHVRIAALDALGTIGDDRALDTLRRCSTDADDNVAAAALAAIASLDHGSALPQLLDAARSTSEARRHASIEGLRRDGRPEAVEALQWLAGADDPKTAQQAIAALSAVAAAATPGGDAAVAALVEFQADDRRAEAAGIALDRLPPERMAALAQGLQHPQAAVRLRTVAALVRSGRADRAMFDRLARTDPSKHVRRAASAAMARLRLGPA